MPLYLLVDSSGSTVLNGFNLGCNQALPQLAAVLEAACGDHARIAAPVTAHPEPGNLPTDWCRACGSDADRAMPQCTPVPDAARGTRGGCGPVRPGGESGQPGRDEVGRGDQASRTAWSR